MTLLQTIALVSALQSPCPHCPKADAAAIYEEAEDYQLPPSVLVWTSFFESSLNASAVGKRGEIGLVQIMPRGPLARKCEELGLDISSMQCAVSTLKYEWAQCNGEWMCFWKVHACGTDKAACGTKIAQTREWIRKQHERRTK
jgi:hypothetical protein